MQLYVAAQIRCTAVYAGLHSTYFKFKQPVIPIRFIYFDRVDRFFFLKYSMPSRTATLELMTVF